MLFYLSLFWDSLSDRPWWVLDGAVTLVLHSLSRSGNCWKVGRPLVEWLRLRHISFEQFFFLLVFLVPVHLWRISPPTEKIRNQSTVKRKKCARRWNIPSYKRLSKNRHHLRVGSPYLAAAASVVYQPFQIEMLRGDDEPKGQEE